MYLIVTNVVLFCTCPALSYTTSVSFAIIIRIRQRPWLGIRGLKTRVPTGIYVEKCCVINMQSVTPTAWIRQYFTVIEFLASRPCLKERA